jgi:hypothetical protein
MNKEQLTQEDYKNLLAMMAVAPINGSQALTVAILQQKINNLLIPTPVSNEKEVPVPTEEKE